MYVGFNRCPLVPRKCRISYIIPSINSTKCSGLKKVGDVRGKTGLINFQTGNTGDKKAEKKLKMAAAVLGCPFILMTADKTTVGANSNQLGGVQAIKTGLGYKY